MPDRPAASASSIAVDLIHDDGDWSSLVDAEGLIVKAADAVARHVEALPAGALASIALSSDEAVSSLNGAFRHKPQPTNVLSFPAGPGSPPGLLGDIILAEETIVREANEQETSLAHHVQHLVVHGLLHLIGYDHQNDDEAEAMENLEIVILRDLGIANPYTGDLNLAKKE